MKEEVKHTAHNPQGSYKSRKVPYFSTSNTLTQRQSEGDDLMRKKIQGKKTENTRERTAEIVTGIL